MNWCNEVIFMFVISTICRSNSFVWLDSVATDTFDTSKFRNRHCRGEYENTTTKLDETKFSGKGRGSRVIPSLRLKKGQLIDFPWDFAIREEHSWSLLAIQTQFPVSLVLASFVSSFDPFGILQTSPERDWFTWLPRLREKSAPVNHWKRWEEACI